ncbi:MAG: hypothetical protein ACT4PG_09780 [Panacagrimonas sp.]
MHVLELNDIGLRLFEGETLLLDSPGCAALDGRRLVVGDEARRRVRLDPRRAHDRYWYQLDANLATPLGAARSAADLAHAQLVSIGEALRAQPLLIAAPASFTPAQLGVLLGLLQAIDARVVGLVDSAVAASSTVNVASQVLHIDVQLHRVICTWMQGGEALQRQRVEEHKPGLAAMQDRCAAVIAQAYVRHARFDPLHNASTEQALYDRVPQWIEQLAGDSNAVLEMDSGGRTHRVSLTREVLEAALAERLDPLAETLMSAARTQQASVLLSARAAALPGLSARFTPAISLDAAAAARGALEHRARIETGETELPWVTRLPRRALALSLVQQGAATHVLIGAHARALPLQGQSLALSACLPGAPGQLRHADTGVVIEHTLGGSVRVNGEAATSARRLALGDRISFGGQELRLIAVDAAEP